MAGLDIGAMSDAGTVSLGGTGGEIVRAGREHAALGIEDVEGPAALAELVVDTLAGVLDVGGAVVLQTEGRHWRILAVRDRSGLGLPAPGIVRPAPWLARVVAELADHPDLSRAVTDVASDAVGPAPSLRTVQVAPINLQGGVLVGAVAVLDERRLGRDRAWSLVDVFGRFLADAYDERWALRELEAEQDQSERQALHQQRLLAEVAHDLRTPLAVIAGMAETIERDTGARERVELAARSIRSNALRLSAMIDGLLDAEAREIGAVRESPTTVDIPELLREIEEHTQHLITRPGVTFVWSGSGSVVAPPLALRRLVLNLVTNAVRWTEAGRVEVRVEEGERSVVLTVSDTGRGMTPDERERFRRTYERGESSVGFGLGLTIVARLARTLGADIDIQSTRGLGTTVSVSLPR